MPERPTRADYGWFCHLATRWMDNDVYGHVNNVTYYSYFDTTANRYLIEHGGLDIHAAPVVGFVVSSSCEFHAPVAFPDNLAIGLRVDRLGERSASYGFAVFCGDEDQARATEFDVVDQIGHFRVGQRRRHYGQQHVELVRIDWRSWRHFFNVVLFFQFGDDLPFVRTTH